MNYVGKISPLFVLLMYYFEYVSIILDIMRLYRGILCAFMTIEAPVVNATIKKTNCV